ncbi:MAG: histidine phosphatase family protein [Myxococcota bacterium]
MTTWTFIRHGQSLANAQGWFAGQRDAPLTGLGREQAEQAKTATAMLSFDRALCSDLSRAHDTAKIITAGRDLAPQVTALLRERTCGTWEGQAIDGIEAAGEMDAFRQWTARPGGGESLRDVAQRVCTYFAGLPEVASTLVVSHGALMRAVLGLVDGTPTDAIGDWRPKNCEVVTRQVSAARWSSLAASLT